MSDHGKRQAGVTPGPNQIHAPAAGRVNILDLVPCRQCRRQLRPFTEMADQGAVCAVEAAAFQQVFLDQKLAGLQEIVVIVKAVEFESGDHRGPAAGVQLGHQIALVGLVGWDENGNFDGQYTDHDGTGDFPA